MEGFFGFLIFVGAVAFPFVAMPLMWRRMKRVRAQVYEEAEAPRSQPAWEEVTETDQDLKLSKAHSPNDDLIALGARANRPPWTLSNQ